MRHHPIFRSLVVLVLAAGVASCANKPKTPKSPIGNFIFLQTPTSDLRIGAEHISGEIVGEGANESELVVAQSLTTSEISDYSGIGGAVHASLYRFLGISAEVAKEHAMHIALEGLETVSLKSPLATSPRAQTDIVYAGLRVAGISITADTAFISSIAVRSEVSSAFAIDLNPSSTRSSLRQVGEGLYVGYKLLKFGDMKVTTDEAEIDSLVINGRQYHAAAYAELKSLNIIAELNSVSVSSCLAAALVWSPGVYYKVWQESDPALGFTCGGGVEPAGKVVVTERLYPFSFAPAGSL